MLFRFDDFDRAFEMVNQIQRRLDRAFEAGGDRGGALGSVDLHETEDALRLTVDLPGVADEDLEITLKEEVLTLAGKRAVDVPEGFRAHLQERRPYSFTRSFSLPTRVDPEQVTAHLDAGVLTVELPKAAEVKPRQISVKAS
ncbi:MAG: Hsp20/alpha crystallin family protein [Myxococcales bacterium]|nr:Hsp20/alpha crystallin family protein [Myxococcales bacterium]